jgi:hypothetical protein
MQLLRFISEAPALSKRRLPATSTKLRVEEIVVVKNRERKKKANVEIRIVNLDGNCCGVPTQLAPSGPQPLQPSIWEFG